MRLRGSPIRALALAALGAVALAGCAAPSGVAERGARLYDAQCRGCHGGSGGGTVRDKPPPHNANGHTWHHPDCQLQEIVLNGFEDPDAPEGSPTMPAFKDKLAPDEVAAILAYIKGWWTDQQREWQAEVTRSACTGIASP